MTNSHRTAHRLIWAMLVVLVTLGFGLALALRPPIEPPAQADTAPT